MNLLLINFLLLSMYGTTRVTAEFTQRPKNGNRWLSCNDRSCNKKCMTTGYVGGRFVPRPYLTIAPYLLPYRHIYNRPPWECSCHKEKKYGVTPKPITPIQPTPGPFGCTKLTCNKKCVAKRYPCGKCIPLSFIPGWNCRCQKEEKYCVTPKPITPIQPTTIVTTPATTIKIPIHFHAGPCSKDPCIKKCVAEGYLCGICFKNTFVPKPKCICVNSEFNCAPLLKSHSH
ncbi:unnamed protein product [Cylicocyclus nassatus]|uniref:Uncharacterized protein n=1 Tax=Cylicocyclus nassatus TaxID=53992 RepID=A0AA36GP76_CYLNA|nr:unnamed protein product [Cylicocyclus nassatus]